MHAQELCRQVVLHREMARRGVKPLAASLESLRAWLLRHGRHVRRVELVGTCVLDDAAQAHLACCLHACACSGQLEALRVWLAPLQVGSWAPAMRHSLRHLQLGSARHELLINSSLASLSQLTALQLRGKPVSFAAGARLLLSLERLYFADRSSPALPDQVGCSTDAL